MNLKYPAITESKYHNSIAEEARWVRDEKNATTAQKELYAALGYMRAREADLDLMETTFKSSGYDFAAIAREKSVTPADTRTLRVYCPVFSLNDTTPEGLAKKDAAERFMLEYATGTAEERKPHLDRIFNEVEKGMPLPSGDLWREANARVRDEESFLFDSKFCYLQNVITDNPGYVAERFSTPERMERLTAAISYNALYYGMHSTYMSSNNIQQNGRMPDAANKAMMQTSAAMIPEAISKAAVGAQMYANKIAMLDGKTPPNSFIDYNLQRDPATKYNAREIFALKEAFAAGTVDSLTPGVFAAKKQFNDKMYAIFDPVQKKRLAARKLDVFDMIYINGVSATELYKDKYNDLPKDEKESLIKAGIISSMVNDRAKIDVTPIMIDKYGKETLTPFTLRPLVREIQAPLQSQFKRFVNGLFSPFGKPFKNESERLIAAAETPDPEKDARLAEAIEAVQEKITKSEMKAENAAIYKHTEHLRQQPTEFMKICKEFFVKQETEQNEFGKALFGDKFVVEYDVEDTHYRSTTRSDIHIGAAMLFADGYSFDQIYDPDALKEEKRQAGERVQALLEMEDSKDPAIKKESYEALADIYLKYAQRYSEQKTLPIDHTDPKQLAANTRELFGRGKAAYDIHSGLWHVEDIMTAKMGREEFDKFKDKLEHNAGLYMGLGDSVGGVNRAWQPNVMFLFARDSAVASMHMRGEIGAALNKHEGRLGDLDAAPLCKKLWALGGAARSGNIDPNISNYDKSLNADKTLLNLCHNRDIISSAEFIESEDGQILKVKADYGRGVNIALPAQEPQREAKSLNDLGNQPVKV
ncbi:MAG: hypothetical protein LBS19_02355, partial [Clostridiales bacterium]|nr:hypothetical protein [Clostridiales bacterium]